MFRSRLAVHSLLRHQRSRVCNQSFCQQSQTSYSWTISWQIWCGDYCKTTFSWLRIQKIAKFSCHEFAKLDPEFVKISCSTVWGSIIHVPQKHIVMCQAHPVLVKKGESNVWFVSFTIFEPTCAYCTMGSYTSLSVCHWIINLYLGKYYSYESETSPQHRGFIGASRKNTNYTLRSI